MSYIDNGVTTSWRLGAWSASTGYPSAIAFHEERLCFAASPYQPNTVWMSVSGEYDNHAPTDLQSKVLDDNAITYTMASGKVNAIKWLNSGPTLVIGTFGDEWQARASNLQDAITPTNISVVRHTSFGSGSVRPIRIGSSIMFLQRSGRRLRELGYDFETDSLQAKDITVVSDHILRDGTKGTAITYQQEPNSIIWVVRQDGKIAGLTYLKEQDVFAWHSHTFGGAFGSGVAVVESIGAVSNQAGNEDTLYAIVKRTIGGVTKRYIEYLTLEIEPTSSTDKSRFNFLDSSIVYSGAATATITGLNHLEGQTVQVLGNGSYRGEFVVSGGQITLPSTVTYAIVGLSYHSELETLPVEGINPFGPSLGKLKRVDKLIIRILDSMGFKYGPSVTALKPWSLRGNNDPMDAASPLGSEDIPLGVDGGYNRDGTIVIRQENPYPLNILAVVCEGECE